jgi:competence protein ComEC
VFPDQVRIRFFVLGFLFIFGLLCVTTPFLSNRQGAFVYGASQTPFLTVAFLDVGQGDAIFIETTDGVQMLVDGGPNSVVLRELSKTMPILDKSIDVLLATHSDKDHIGGLVDVLKRYQVKDIIHTNNKNDTAVSEAFDRGSVNEGAIIHIAEAGHQFSLGASTTLLILSPEGNPENWESNTASVVLQLQYGETEFILTGDAPVNIEEYIAKSFGNLIQSEVLKLGHHGSRTSTSEMFLNTIKPQYAIVSAGLDNSYGHPHQEVVDKLVARDIKMLNTADEGTIIFKSDGKKVWRE